MFIHYWKDFGFGVEVAGEGFVVGALADPQGRILDSLDFWDIVRGSVWEPDRSCISGDRMDECFVCVKHGLLLMPPGGTSKCLEDFELRFCSGGDCGDVR